MPDRKFSPPIKHPEHIPHIAPRKLVLNNGLPVYLIEGGNEEMLRIELVFKAGSYMQSLPLTAFSATKLMASGTSGKDRQTLMESLDYYGAHLHLDAQKDISSASIHVLNKHLDYVLPLLFEILIDPVYPETEVETFLKNQQQQHLVNQKKVQHLARTTFNELVYGERHPYGYRLKTEDFDQITPNDLTLFQQQWFHPGNAFCLISGRLPVNLEALLQSTLGSADWTARPVPDTPTFLLLAPGSRKAFLEVPGALQSAIRIGKQLFNRTHPAYHPAMVTNALLGGYYGSRLMRNIRQDKGYTYGISSGLVSLLRHGYFFISTQVGSQVREAAVSEIYSELSALRSRPAGKEELQALKAYLEANILRAFDGPFAQSERFKEALVFGLSFSHYEDYLATLKRITPEEIMEVADNFFHEDGMMEVVAGK